MFSALLQPDLSQRVQDRELMDDPESAETELYRTLQQFAFINRHLARVRVILRRHIIHTMQTAPQRNYHLIDLGAGACETAVWLLRKTRKLGLGRRLQITACDHDARVLAFARRNYGDEPGLTIVQANVLDLATTLPPADFIFANHLLHHLRDDEVHELLRNLTGSTANVILLNDLNRSRSSYFFYNIFAALFLRHSFAHADGLQSIRRGFRTNELVKLLPDSAFPETRPWMIQRFWPGHILLISHLPHTSPCPQPLIS